MPGLVKMRILIGLISHFLQENTFQFKIRGHKYLSNKVTVEVSQGSVLSSIMYSIYTTDFLDCPRIEIARYADVIIIMTKDRSQRCTRIRLQHTTRSLEEWTSKWKIGIKVDKNIAVLFNNKRPGIIWTYSYFMMPRKKTARRHIRQN